METGLSQTGQKRSRSPLRQYLHPEICSNLSARPPGGKTFEFTTSPLASNAAQSGQVWVSPRLPSGTLATAARVASILSLLKNEKYRYTKIAAKQAATAITSKILIFLRLCGKDRVLKPTVERHSLIKRHA
jgi:hypothetical protein